MASPFKFPGSTGKKGPLVSVCCLTHNHEAWIGGALDSFLAQRTDFPFEVMVFDDASTDTTADIIKQYQSRHPDIIRPFFASENIFSRTHSLYQVYTRHALPLCRGKYIAICEGDDYWTDPLKLQEQAGFLERNRGYYVCFHYTGIEKDGVVDHAAHHRNTGNILKGRTDFELRDLIRGSFIPNCSVMYRKTESPYPAVFDDMMLPDWPLHCIHAAAGKIRYLDEDMAVHRVHSVGLWNGLGRKEQLETDCAILERLCTFLGPEYHREIDDAIGFRRGLMEKTGYPAQS